MTLHPPHVRRALAVIADHKKAVKAKRRARVEGAPKLRLVADAGTTRGSVGKAMARQIYDDQGGVCEDCKEFIGLKPYDIDHRTALGLKGQHTRANLRALCIPCHKIKTRRDKRLIAKAKRQARQGKPKPNRRPIPSRSFS